MIGPFVSSTILRYIQLKQLDCLRIYKHQNVMDIFEMFEGSQSSIVVPGNARWVKVRHAGGAGACDGGGGIIVGPSAAGK